MMATMHPFGSNWVNELLLLTAGFFLLCSFGLIAAAQVLGCLRIYVFQSLLLAVSAGLLAFAEGLRELLIVAVMAIVAKVILLPWLLRRTARKSMMARREVQQVINVPTSLLIALALSFLAYFFTAPLLEGASGAARCNLPVGFAACLIAIYTITVRREALPQMLSLLAIENGAFYAGIGIAPTFPLIGELAAIFDVLMIVLVLGILSQEIHVVAGSTKVGSLSELREV
ncbi:MAG: hypothetical protein ACP5O7_05510 [Phycisphaerae bacterium]